MTAFPPYVCMWRGPFYGLSVWDVGSEEILVVVTEQVASPAWSPCQPARATNVFPDMSKGKSTSCCEKGTCSLDLQF